MINFSAFVDEMTKIAGIGGALSKVPIAGAALGAGAGAYAAGEGNRGKGALVGALTGAGASMAGRGMIMGAIKKNPQMARIAKMKGPAQEAAMQTYIKSNPEAAKQTLLKALPGIGVGTVGVPLAGAAGGLASRAIPQQGQ